MTKKVVTNDGKKGGWLVGKRHYDKDGKPLGGIKAVVTDAGGKPVELEGGEVIINREASKKYWKELSRINQSAGNGVPIEPPTDAFDEDPAEDYENGGKIEFNANHIPNKWILNYAIKIKAEHPDVWALGGNIFGNQAFINLKRVAERGHWLDSEEWMYKKWRAFVARHQGDFRIQGVIAMLKWVDKVDKGWQYMKNLIEEEIKKREARKSKKMQDGGGVTNTNAEKFMQWYIEWYKPISDSINITFSLPNELLPFKEKNVVILDLFEKKNQNIDAKKYLHEIVKKADELGVTIYLEPKPSDGYYKNSGFNVTENKKFMKRLPQMNNGGNLSKTPAPASERIKGSKFNAPGTAKDSKSGANIKFDDNTLASIKSLIDAHNEKYPSKEITLGVAKAVVRRGMGAYSGTHRPTITGGKPNSRTAWGLARFNAFIYKIVNGKSKSGNYTQDDDLIEELGLTVSKYAKGGEIIVKTSQNLTPNQINNFKIALYANTSNLNRIKEINDENVIVLDDNGAEYSISTSSVIFDWQKMKHDFNNSEILNKLKNQINNNIDVKIQDFNRKLDYNENHKYRSKTAKQSYSRIFKGKLKYYNSFREEILSVIDLFDDLDIIVSKFNKGGGIDKIKTSKDENGNWKGKYLDYKFTLYHLPEGWSFTLYYYSPLMLSDDMYFSDQDFPPFMTKKAAIQSLIEVANDLKNKYKHGGLIAPNGKSSNLTPEQYKLVRTPAFKAWFGDWENDPKNASKVVDENGEPLICVHNTNRKFYKFDENKIGTNTDDGFYSKGFYFSPVVSELKYGEVELDCFLNLRNPYKEENSNKIYELNSDKLKNKGFDGVIVYSTWKKNMNLDNGFSEIVAYYPNQIKLADGTNTTFNENNLDIRFAVGGGIEKEIPVRVDYLEQQLFENNKDIQVPKSVYKEYSKSGKVPKDIVDDLSSEIDEKHWIETTPLSVHLTPLNKMAKGGLIAPNGKLSNLTPEQHKLVRTPEFKAWFGDWENDPKNASKVVDENGEPLVVYRGDSSASKKGFVFKTGYNRMSYISKDRLPNQYFHYFVDNYDVALGYGQNQIEDHNEKVAASGKGKLWEASVTPYFLSIKNPIDITPSNTLFPTFSQSEKLVKKIHGQEGFLQQKYRIGYDYGFYITEADLNRILENKLGKDYLENTKETEERYSYIDEWQKNSFRNSYYPEKTFAYFIEYKNSRSRSDILRRIYLKMLNKNVDGMVFLESTNWKTDFFENWRKYESGELKYDSKRWVEKPKVFAALESNQIKLADGTNIKFDSENPDIRFEEGGNVDAKDSVTIDIPLMIRLLELSREDVKSDAELHFVVENLLKLKNKPILTMDDYAFIADVEHNHLKKYDLGGKMPESEKRVDLGFGGLGNGTTVWDRNRIHNNDFKIVAHISNEGKITYYDKKLPEYAINQIESMAENEKKRYEDMNGLSTGYDFNPIQTPLN